MGKRELSASQTQYTNSLGRETMRDQVDSRSQTEFIRTFVAIENNQNKGPKRCGKRSRIKTRCIRLSAAVVMVVGTGSSRVQKKRYIVSIERFVLDWTGPSASKTVSDGSEAR
jgi:hypothetical protein